MIPALRAFLLTIAASAALLASGVQAQGTGWPARAVRIVAAQQAGSAADNIARIFADALADAWAQPVVVDNRPGASGAIGTLAVARATADGYTLLLGGLSNMVTSPLLDPGYEIDPVGAFVAIGRVAFVPFVLAVHPDVPAASLGDLVAHVRGNPGKIVFATSGPTAFSRLCIDLLAQHHGVDFLVVEYRGAPAATLDLVAGRAQLQVQELATMKAHDEAGRVRVIAIAGDRRATRLPAVPTFGEASAVPIPLTPWYGLFAPSGVAPDVLARLEAGYRTAMRDAKVLARIEALGYEPIVDEPGRFAAALRRDLGEVRAMARRTGRTIP